MSTENASTPALRAHVVMLAGTIGERNVYHPQNLRAAAHDIAHLERFPIR